MSLISNKAPNLHSVIYSEINTASVTNKRLLLNERGSCVFMFSLEIVTFYCQKGFTTYYLILYVIFYVS